MSFKTCLTETNDSRTFISMNQLRCFIISMVMLFSTFVWADKTEPLFDGTLPLADSQQTIKKCRHGHDATPIFVSLTWIDGAFTHHVERIEVCPVCYKRMLAKETGY